MIFSESFQNFVEAARLFGVPYSTLIDGSTGRIAIGANTWSDPTTLTPYEEAEIAETCIAFADWGFGMGRREVDICRPELPEFVTTSEKFFQRFGTRRRMVEWFIKRHSESSQDGCCNSSRWLVPKRHVQRS